MANTTFKKLDAFDPPGFPHTNDNLTPEQRSVWSSQKISSWMDAEIDGDGGETKLPQFFNGTVEEFDVDQKPLAITWVGFPGLVSNKTGGVDMKRWPIADSQRHTQDEYLEWTSGRMKRYWQFLAEESPEKLLSLYKSLNPQYASQIKMEDLFQEDKKRQQTYEIISTNPGCIVHLAHRNNTLQAEIDIAAQATVIRKDDHGKIITDKTQLIRCSRYGQESRNSDPKIGDEINKLAPDEYMMEFSASKFALDVDGTGENLKPIPDGTFRFVRGDIKKKTGLRLHVQIPDGIMSEGDNAGRQLTVSDIFDTEKTVNIQFGAQFADYIHMGVNGIVIGGEPGQPAEPKKCPGKKTPGIVSNLSSMEECTTCKVDAGVERFSRYGTR
ncbi:hypothetical protein QBC46DRAFT_353084 [Diplogelasinospora grovesii]|uniref:Uncharacterized protein n=1 Tax=Diplogelasinospora grovesii TaxID=303347 RepID=A0AAN6NBB7_9PEZI|nr:hypothetical protein QBC46DRAFT_353084 [Diplogelasinospora grovesii]